MKNKKLLAAVLATMIVVTAVLFVACNNTDDMSKNIYEGNYTTLADEKAVAQLQTDVQKLAADNTTTDGKTAALGYRMAVVVKGTTQMQGAKVNVDGTAEGLVTTDGKNASMQLTAKVNVTMLNPETNKDETLFDLNGTAWADTATNKAYADIAVEYGGTKMSGKYYTDLSQLQGSGSTDVSIDLNEINFDDLVKELQTALADTNTKVYVDGDNKYKIEATIDGTSFTVYLYKTNDGKLCFKLESIIEETLNVSLDLRPTQDKVKLPENTDEYKKFDGSMLG